MIIYDEAAERINHRNQQGCHMSRVETTFSPHSSMKHHVHNTLIVVRNLLEVASKAIEASDDGVTCPPGSCEVNNALSVLNVILESQLLP